MPNFEYDPDGQFCPGCGINLEVIGPPGPIHKAGCPHKTPAPPPSRPVTGAELDEVFHRMGQGGDVDDILRSVFPEEF
jgi:hypothetical protein